MTALSQRADKEEEMQPGERATAAEEGGREFQDRRHAGVLVCVSSRASPAWGLTFDGESLCTASRSNSSIIYHDEVQGISKANCK